MSPRNAQGLSVSTLIMIALGILVLIMSIVFYNNIVDRSEETAGNCGNLGGECQSSCPTGTLTNSLGTCPQGQQCCVRPAAG